MISGAKVPRTAIFDEGQWIVTDQEMGQNQTEPMTGGEGTLMITRKEQKAECLTCHRPWQEGSKIIVFGEQEARRRREYGQETELPMPELESRRNGRHRWPGEGDAQAQARV